MKLFYWKSPSGNFGDDLNLWLWDNLLPGWQEWDRARWLIGVGTILNRKLLPPVGPRLVIGSGVGFGTVPQLAPPNAWDVRCVRGPRTARALGLPEDTGIIDPAVMTARLSEFLEVELTNRALYIPHCHSDVDPDYDWPSICAQADLLYLSPRGDSREVTRMIAGARLVISESMHGAIVADAFRVPWRAVSLVSNFNEFKWRDWTESLSMDIEIVPLSRPLRQARRLVQGVRRRLSSTRDRERFTTSQAGYNRLGSNCSSLLPRNVAVSALQSVQQKLVVRTLRRLAASEPYLSNPAILARRMDALQEKLDGIIKDYSGST